MQDELAALSSDSVHMTAVNAGHNVHLDEPLLVVQAIRDPSTGADEGQRRLLRRRPLTDRGHGRVQAVRDSSE